MLAKDYQSVYDPVSKFLERYSVRELMYVIGEAIGDRDDKKWIDAFKKKDNDVLNAIKFEEGQINFFDFLDINHDALVEEVKAGLQ